MDNTFLKVVFIISGFQSDLGLCMLFRRPTCVLLLACHLILLCVIWRGTGIRNRLVVYISPSSCYFCPIFPCIPHGILFSDTFILQREWNSPLSKQDVLLVSRKFFLSKAMRRIQSQRQPSSPISVLPNVHTFQTCKHIFLTDRAFSM